MPGRHAANRRGCTSLSVSLLEDSRCRVATGIHGESGFTVMTFRVGVGALLGTFALTFLTTVPRGPLLRSGDSEWPFAAAYVGPRQPADSRHQHRPDGLLASNVHGHQRRTAAGGPAGRGTGPRYEPLPDGGGRHHGTRELIFASLADAWGVPILFLLPALAYLVTLPSARGPAHIYAMSTAPAGCRSRSRNLLCFRPALSGLRKRTRPQPARRRGARPPRRPRARADQLRRTRPPGAARRRSPPVAAG